MTLMLLARRTVPILLALAAGLVGPSASPALAAGTCATPILSAVIDPMTSDPLSPRIVLQADGLSLPAQGHFEWGDGQYGVARLDDGDGALGVATDIQPIYATAGTYLVKMSVTDACGSTTDLVMSVDVPLRLPSEVEIACPTAVDASGYCVVPLGSTSVFTVGGGATGPWRWNRAGAHVRGASLSMRAAELGTVHLQATARTRAGWLVTPVLAVITVAPPRPRITEFSDPLRATVDEPLSVRFTVPPGVDGGGASILVDDRKVADGTSATLRLEAGTHMISYAVVEADGGVIVRQAVVVASPPPPPVGLIAGAATLSVGLLAVALVSRRRHRHRRASRLAVAPTQPVRSQGTTP